MMGICPRCESLVSITVAEVLPSGRYIYRTRFHAEGKCRGGLIK